jgi:hypothetical protein
VIRPEPPPPRLSQDENDWVFFTRIEVELMHLIINEPSEALQLKADGYLRWEDLPPDAFTPISESESEWEIEWDSDLSLN